MRNVNLILLALACSCLLLLALACFCLLLLACLHVFVPQWTLKWPVRPISVSLLVSPLCFPVCLLSRFKWGPKWSQIRVFFRAVVSSPFFLSRPPLGANMADFGGQLDPQKEQKYMFLRVQEASQLKIPENVKM